MTRLPEGIRLGKHSLFGNVNPADFAGVEPEPVKARTVPVPQTPSRGKLRLPVINQATGLRECTTCPAPCCTMLIAGLTKTEVASGLYEYVQDNEGKYYLPRPFGRCTYLDSSNFCTIYNRRPSVCSGYRCDNPGEEDERISRWFLKNCE